jgi:hypothetical protein
VGRVFLQREFEDNYDFDFFLEDLRNTIAAKYPSLTLDDRWAGYEAHIIASNHRAEVSVSEYCGIVRIDIAPRDEDNPLDVGWARRVANSFERWLIKHYRENVLVSMGTFSNGEQCFRPLDRPDGVVTSKEGTLW